MSTADRAGQTYSHGHGEPVLRSHRWRTAENSAAYLLPHLRPGDRLLDVGTGPGTITVDLAGRVPEGEVLGVDAAAEAVEATRALAGHRGVTNLRTRVADVYRLDLPAVFDVVHAHQVLQHLRDPVAALRAMGRVCRPSGLVAVRDADYGAMTWFPASAALTRWRELYETLARGNGGEPDAGRRLRGWVRAAGLAEVRASGSLWCFASAEDLAWWTTTWAERLTGSALAEQAVAAQLSDAQELRDLADGWRTWGRQPDAWFAVPHGEVLARA